MDPKKLKQKVSLVLPKKQVMRLHLLRQALSEKMGREMTIDELVQTIVDEFLES